MKDNKEQIKRLQKLAHLGKADLHIHSDYSDGQPSIEEILDYVQDKTDLDVIAICDHDTIEGALKAAEIVSRKKYRFQVIVGEEISTTEGHILGLFIKKPIPKGVTARHALERIRKQGGITIVPHPFENTRMKLPNHLTMDGVGLVTLIREKKLINCVEIVNATPTLGEENLRAAFVNRTLLLKAETGSSDAHILEAIGKGYTLFEGDSAMELRHALVCRQTRAVYGKWTLLALAKYLFFFIPIGLRMTFYTLLCGGGLEQKPEVTYFE